MLTRNDALKFAHDWIDAWNDHDLARVLAHYTDEVEMTSPFITKLTGEPSGTLRGKAAVRDYWTLALGRMPDLQFELIEVMSAVDTICIYYRSVLGLLAVEWLHIGSDGRAVRAIAHYDRA